MKETELVEKMAENSPLTNLFLMAEQVQFVTTARIFDEFYWRRIGYNLAVELLTAIVF